MLNFFNKTLFCLIDINVSKSKSTYITDIKTIYSKQYKNMYTYYFNLDGHRDEQFSGELRWWKTEKECLQWIKYLWTQKLEWHLEINKEFKGKYGASLCDPKFLMTISWIEMLNKKKYLTDLLVHKDFTKSPLSFYLYTEEKLLKYEKENGVISITN